jgi:hypothetical protein
MSPLSARLFEKHSRCQLGRRSCFLCIPSRAYIVYGNLLTLPPNYSDSVSLQVSQSATGSVTGFMNELCQYLCRL